MSGKPTSSRNRKPMSYQKKSAQVRVGPAHRGHYRNGFKSRWPNKKMAAVVFCSLLKSQTKIEYCGSRQCAISFLIKLNFIRNQIRMQPSVHYSVCPGRAWPVLFSMQLRNLDIIHGTRLIMAKTLYTTGHSVLAEM